MPESFNEQVRLGVCAAPRPTATYPARRDRHARRRGAACVPCPPCMRCRPVGRWAQICDVYPCGELPSPEQPKNGREIKDVTTVDLTIAYYTPISTQQGAMVLLADRDGFTFADASSSWKRGR